MKTLIGIIVSAQYGPVCVATFTARKGLLKSNLEAIFECISTLQYPDGTFADVIAGAFRKRVIPIPLATPKAKVIESFGGFSSLKGRAVKLNAIPEFAFYCPLSYCHIDITISDADTIVFVDPQDHGITIEKTLTANLRSVVQPAKYTSSENVLSDMRRRIYQMTVQMNEFAAQCKENGIENGLFTVGETPNEQFAIQGSGSTSIMSFTDLENHLISEVVKNLKVINDQQAGKKS